MCTSEFPIFCHLLNEIHLKIFGESLKSFDQAKSRAMSWFIYQATGDAVSYKSLCKYAFAVLNAQPAQANPTETTLGILAHFLRHDGAKAVPSDAPRFTCWYQYRRAFMEGASIR
jgi:hypothetical protein